MIPLATPITLRDAVRSNRPTCALLLGATIYEPLLTYFRERSFGIESERSYALAVSRLMNWLNAGHATLSATHPETINARLALTQNLFNNFLHDLLNGTIQGSEDPTGLWWKPSSSKTTQLTAQRLAEFSDWLAIDQGTSPLNPTDRHASNTEQIRALRSFATKKRASAMAHAKSSSTATADANVTRRISVPSRKTTTMEMIAAFPADRIDELLWKGFENEEHKDDTRPWIRWNLRDILTTLLCLYGGCRESEPLHLWVDDVFENPAEPASCQVLIHHPEQGLIQYRDPATCKIVHTSRQDYLNRFCDGKKPLTMETGRRHSGWKGCLLTDRKRKAFHVFWIDASAGRLFRQLWALYIQHVRPVQPKTPWAFLTKNGQPMGTGAYIDSFKRAVEKIGLESGKWNGTTPHGLRHRYGQWLNELEIESKHGQICMHHASVSSQAVYRSLTPEQVAEAIRTAPSSNRPHIPSLPLEPANHVKT